MQDKKIIFNFNLFSTNELQTCHVFSVSNHRDREKANKNKQIKSLKKRMYPHNSIKKSGLISLFKLIYQIKFVKICQDLLIIKTPSNPEPSMEFFDWLW